LLDAALRSVDGHDAHLAAVVDHLTSHFEAEARWMHDSGYPNSECHLDEHAAVLASAHEVLALDATYRPTVARAFVEELAAWFPAHAQHLDSALAHWMVKRAHGGKPVVFHAPRRSIERVSDAIGHLSSEQDTSQETT
jgi:hemerythrin